MRQYLYFGTSKCELAQGGPDRTQDASKLLELREMRHMSAPKPRA